MFFIIYFTIPALHIEGGYGEIGDCSDLFKKSERAYEKNGNILHLGTLPAYVPEAIENLLYWVKNSELDMLVKSCVFHYEFELIHPFSDGNGRLGRLWHTLLLSLRNPLFAWLPIESIVHDNQDKYYASINKSNADGSGTAFAEFMLEIIKTALEEALSASTQAAIQDGRN